MDIKNSIYAIIFVATTGACGADRALISAPAQGGELAGVGTPGVVAPAPTVQEIMQQLTNRRQRAALENPQAPDPTFLNRVGQAARTTGRYGFNMGRNTAAIGGVLAPTVWFALKDNFRFGPYGDMKEYLAAAVGLAAVLGGLYSGWRETSTLIDQEQAARDTARRLAETEIDLTNAAGRLVESEGTVTRLEQMHGTLQAMEGALQLLQQEQTTTRGQLQQLQAAGQAATALSQIDSLEGSLARDAQLWQAITSSMDSRTFPALRQRLLQRVQGMIQVSQAAQEARAAILGEVRGNRVFMTEPHEQMIDGLRQQVQRMLGENQQLFPQIESFIEQMRQQYEREQRVAQLHQRQGIVPSAVTSSTLKLLNGSAGDDPRTAALEGASVRPTPSGALVEELD